MEQLSLELISALRLIGRIKREVHQSAFLGRGEIDMLSCLYCAQKAGVSAMSASQIGQRLGVSRPAVTAILNQANKLGMIRRQTDTQDKRRILISLTDKGQELFTGISEQMQQKAAHLLEQMGEEDARQLVLLVRKAMDIILQGNYASTIEDWQRPANHTLSR